MLTCTIAAFDRRDITTVDITGAFLQTKMPTGEHDVHFILNGKIAELLAKISPKRYQEYFHQRQEQASYVAV